MKNSGFQMAGDLHTVEVRIFVACTTLKKVVLKVEMLKVKHIMGT